MIGANIEKMSKTFAQSTQTLFEQQKAFLSVLGVMIVFALIGMPAEVYAAPGTLPATGSGGTMATSTSGFIKQYGNYIIFGSGVVTFLMAGYWIIGSVNGYIAKEPGQTLGKVGLTLFLSVLVTIMVMFFFNEALQLLKDNF